MSLQQLIEHGLVIGELKPSKRVEVADKLQIMLRNYIDLVNKNKGDTKAAEEAYEKEEQELIEFIKIAVN